MVAIPVISIVGYDDAGVWHGPVLDVILHCPSCHLQHIDAPDPDTVARSRIGTEAVDVWRNPPHRSHLCHGCGFIWRPADVPTNGVAKIQTHGEKDSRRFDVD